MCYIYIIYTLNLLLFRTGNNCLKSTENHSPGPEMSRLASQQFGTVYAADDQCSMIYGHGSYLCRVSHPHLENQYYPIKHIKVTIGLPVKRHLNGVSLEGR